MKNTINEQLVYAPRKGSPGYRLKKPDGTLGPWIELDPKERDSPEVIAAIKRYNELKKNQEVEPPAPQNNRGPKSTSQQPPAPQNNRGPKSTSQQPPAPQNNRGPKSTSQQPPKPKPQPQLPDIRGGDGETKYGDGTPIETKKEPESPKEKPQSEPPRQDPPKPRQTPQQKAGLPARVPTKFVSRVAQYQKDRASAVKSGDPVEMQKVRTSGMEIWKKANPELANAAAEKARIRGTAQTDNPLIDKQMRSRMPLNSPSVQSPRVAKLGSGNQSVVNNPNAFKAAKRPATPATSAKPVATPANRPATPATPATSAKPDATSAKTDATSAKTDATSAKPKKGGPTPIKVEPFKESYDVVLEYLLDGHADTINEANYIMLEMDSQTIQYIVDQS